MDATGIGGCRYKDGVCNLKATQSIKQLYNQSNEQTDQIIVTPKTKKINSKIKNIKKKRINHKGIKVGTLNTNTLKKVGKLHQLFTGAKKANIDLLAVQETKLRIDNETELEEFEDIDKTYTLIYSTATSRGQGGVGLLVNNKFKNLIKSKKKISPRILSVTFENNPEITVISVYAPTDNSDDDSKNQFYDDLTNYLNSIPKHNIKIVAGDLNAQVGHDLHQITPKVVGNFAYHESTNDKGTRLVVFAKLPQWC